MTVKSNDFERRQARSRLRELSKYYCAISSFTNSDESLTNLNSDRKSGLHAAELDGQGSKPLTLVKPRLTSDETLTALAQLATLKSRCERCYVSIIDGNAQHIIAEATKSISLSDQDDYLLGDALILGLQTLPLDYGLSTLAIDAFAGSSKRPCTFQGSESTSNYIYISDLTQEPLTKDARILRHIPHPLKFYLAAPLRSQSGALIGLISVLDPVSRPKAPRDIKCLEEIAALVVKHLDGIRIREDHRRTERLLDALSYFNQGEGTMGTVSLGSERPPNHTVPPESSESATTNLTSFREEDRPKLSSVRSSYEVPRISSGDAHVQSGTFAASSSVSDRSASPTISQNIPDNSVSQDELATGIERQSTSLTSMAVKEAFSRASNLIRESMDLDATCFLEIPQNERFKNSARTSVKRAKAASGQSGSSSIQQNDQSTTDATLTSSESAPSNDEGEGRNDKDVLCHRLAFSSRGKSSFASSSTTNTFLTVSVRLLTRLAAKYPKGHIFHFDEAGSMSSSDESVQIEKNKPKVGVTRVKISGELCGHFPTAKSLIFLPLYDNERQTQYAGFLGWTSNPVRALQNHEIVYVLGFTNSLMCEVMRLETLATDKAKSDFISSISHELRSPLHGILAAGQLLSESKISSSQAEFVEMVDTCARTLLDIMNHLLEHAKINNFTKTKNTKFKPKGAEGRIVTRKPGVSYSSITSVNLSSVVEETVESMVASSYRMIGRDDSDNGGHASFSEQLFLGRDRSIAPLTIILSIDFHDPLVFNTEAGSWRRIVMNLLGNSLKYTQGGYVMIRLNVQKLEGSKSMAELTVVDTGQGISGEFLKHRLYTPFAQEDNLSVGAGLGLSIVHQIVKSLNGKIRVDSEIGTGTEISVQVPLGATSQKTEITSAGGTDNPLLIQELKGKRVKFYGFGESSNANSDSASHARSRANALAIISQSLRSLLEDWFGVIRTTTDQADIIVIEETWLVDNLELVNVSWANVIVVGSRLQPERSDQIPYANVTHASCPIGPHRMARTLRNLLIDWRDHETNNGSPPQAMDLDSAISNNISTLGITESFTTTAALSGSTSVTLLNAKSTPPPLRPSSAKSQTPALPAIPNPNPPSSAAKSLVLLVDDNEINLRILATCVKKFQSPTMQFVEARNGKEALDKYIAAMNAGLRIPLIFMDISMPVMDGFTATRLIRNFEKSQGMDQTSQAVIVAFTGLASEQAQHDVEKYGFDLYYRKPVNVKTVRELVETTLVRNERPSSESAISP